MSIIKYSFVMKSIYCRLFCLFVVLNLAQTYTISSHFGSQISQVTISDQESYLKKKKLALKSFLKNILKRISSQVT